MTSSVRWAFGTVAPWVLAAGVLVSMAADAGVDASGGFQVSTMTQAPLGTAGMLVPPVRSSLLTASPAIPGRYGLIHTARLPAEEPSPDAYAGAPAPRAEMKAGNKSYPVVDRTHKGDPILVLRPSLSQSPSGLRRGERMLTGRNVDLLPPTILLPPSFDAPDSVTAFEPSSDAAATTPGTALGGASSGSSTSQSTAAARASGSTTTGIGSTPTVPRAVSLSSTTPAPADATPVEIAAAPVSLDGLNALRSRSIALGSPGQAGVTVAPKTDDLRPSYASLLDPENLNKEERCLAEAVYFEARSEPEEGQAAVAQVVLNRVKSGLYPASVCGVVYQNRHRKFACQFSFACEGKALRITETEHWKMAVRIAREVTFGQTYNADVGGATHYHANYVKPFWAKRLKKMDVIGRHIFYKLKPGQT
ncbi:cell wall hydrolase [Alsobacter sp. KACC 23698]|uniref:Cell wall hydrolase n=1 Tax=Alsobacter sp. KACC 23698 TaxID=3149229 RepID=A0AAU7JJW3_9HYPH